MTEIQPDLAAFATAELRRRGMEIHTSTTIERVGADSVELSTGEIVPARPSPGPPASSRIRSSRGSGCRWTTAAGSSPTASAPSTGVAGRLGDRRCRRGPRSRAARARRHRRPRSTCCARPRSPPTTSRTRWPASRGAAPVPLPDAGRVRRHGPPPGGGEHARHQVARLPGLVPRPHLPPGADAGDRAPRAARDRLDDGAAVRARLGGARAARPSARAGAQSAGGRTSEAGGDEVVGGPARTSTTERARAAELEPVRGRRRDRRAPGARPRPARSGRARSAS